MVAFQISPKIESLYGLSRQGSYGILQLLQACHLNSFPLKTLKLGWVAFHSLKSQLKCLDFQSKQYKKLAPVVSRFCNWLCKSKFFCRARRGLGTSLALQCYAGRLSVAVFPVRLRKM